MSYKARYLYDMALDVSGKAINAVSSIPGRIKSRRPKWIKDAIDKYNRETGH